MRESTSIMNEKIIMLLKSQSYQKFIITVSLWRMLVIIKQKARSHKISLTSPKIIGLTKSRGANNKQYICIGVKLQVMRCFAISRKP